MTVLYTEDASGGVKFSSERKPGEVWIPNYVYDMWLPLLGATVIGIYSTYCRLERGDSVKAKTLDELAYTFHVGKNTLLKVNKQLVDCGFIRVIVPTGHQRLMHWTTEIVLLDPPKEVSAELIEKYRPKGYKLLCPWLSDTEVPTGTTGGSDENHDDVPIGTAKIAAPGSLNSKEDSQSVSLRSTDCTSVPPKVDASTESKPAAPPVTVQPDKPISTELFKQVLEDPPKSSAKRFPPQRPKASGT